MARRIKRAPSGEYYLTQEDERTFDRILNPREVQNGITEDGYVIPKVAKAAGRSFAGEAKKRGLPELKLEAPLTLGQKAGRLLAGTAPIMGGIAGKEI